MSTLTLKLKPVPAYVTTRIAQNLEKASQEQIEILQRTLRSAVQIIHSGVTIDEMFEGKDVAKLAEQVPNFDNVLFYVKDTYQDLLARGFAKAVVSNFLKEYFENGGNEGFCADTDFVSAVKEAQPFDFGFDVSIEGAPGRITKQEFGCLWARQTHPDSSENEISFNIGLKEPASPTGIASMMAVGFIFDNETGDYIGVRSDVQKKDQHFGALVNMYTLQLLDGVTEANTKAKESSEPIVRSKTETLTPEEQAEFADILRELVAEIAKAFKPK